MYWFADVVLGKWAKYVNGDKQECAGGQEEFEELHSRFIFVVACSFVAISPDSCVYVFGQVRTVYLASHGVVHAA